MSDLVLPPSQVEKRSALAREYGPTLVRNAEHDTLISILLHQGMFTADEFLDLVGTRLASDDAKRKADAGY